MHLGLILVKKRFNQANQQDTLQRPDSTLCNQKLMVSDHEQRTYHILVYMEV